MAIMQLRSTNPDFSFLNKEESGKWYDFQGNQKGNSIRLVFG
jgi:hypothetical protein